MSFTNGKISGPFLVGDVENGRRLGRDRLGIFTGDKDKSTITQFVNS